MPRVQIKIVAAALLALATQPAQAVKAETAAVLLSTTVLGVQAGIAALRGQPSWAAQLRDASTADGWLLRVESEGPRGAFADTFRDIRVTTVDVTRAWRLPYGVEFQAGGGLLDAQGDSGEPFSEEPMEDSDAYGIHVGPGLRLNLPAWKGLRLYADTSAHLLLTTPEFPAGGTQANGLIRHGFGLSYELGTWGRLEAGWHQGHVSNGSGEGDQNPAWDGEGYWLGWRFLI
jgi:hypothetical protein